MSEGTSTRVLLFGGSFDPPTHAHLIVPEWVMGEIGAESVWFIPAYHNPMKKQDTTTDPELRLEMLRLAISGHPSFEIQTLELERGGPSYTVETLRELQMRHPDKRFSLLMGGDALQNLPHWREYEEVLRLADVVTVQRPGWTFEALPADIEDAIQRLEMPGLELSATLVRDRIAAGKPWRSMVPGPVAEFIVSRNLYVSES